MHRIDLALVGDVQALQSDRITDVRSRFLGLDTQTACTTWHADTEFGKQLFCLGLVHQFGLRYGHYLLDTGHGKVFTKPRAAVESHEGFAKTLQWGDTSCSHQRAQFIRETFRNRGHHDTPPTGGGGGIGKGFGCSRPTRCVEVWRIRRVEHEHGGIMRAVHRLGEGAGHRHPVAPHESVVVERVGHADEFGERRGDSLVLLRGEGFEAQSGVLGKIGHQAGLAAGARQ